MDNKLKQLFDYQKFTKNPRLDEVISQSESDCAVELNDESLFAVAGGKQKEDVKDKLPKQLK